ncbi:MAG: ChbG/HpnK family deacetylase [Spongiibacteraceae bacterium]
MKAIILCADDYALNPAVDAGILQLVEMGRLSAVGCMTESPRWLDHHNRLPALRDRIDIGLHFNLTQSFGAGRNSEMEKQPLPSILRGALLGTLPLQAIADSLHAQLDRFESVMGDAPDFVDGHQHVHIFPRIRQTVLETLARRYRLRRPWLRQVNPTLTRGPDWHKRALLALLNWRFAATAQQLGFACNQSFTGIYSLLPEADFPALMRQWLADASAGELLMCHPGQAVADSEKKAAAIADDIAMTRPRELAWLASPEFGELLSRQQISLVRFRDLAPQTAR